MRGAKELSTELLTVIANSLVAAQAYCSLPPLMNAYLIVFLGSGLGGMLRYAANVWVPRMLGGAFPYQTLLVNILGSLVMGVLIGFFASRYDPGQNWRLFLTTGIMGGFTTFSAFALDTVVLYERGEGMLAACYVLASVVVSLAALFAGLMMMRAVYGVVR